MPTTSQLVNTGRKKPAKKLATPGLKSGKGRKKKVAAAEWKRLVDLQQVITAEKAMALVACVQAIIVRHVGEPHALAGIAQDLRGIVDARGAGPQIDFGGSASDFA